MSRTIESRHASNQDPQGQSGTATLTAVLILALLGVFTAAAMSRVTTGQQIMGNDLGNSKAFYAAQASLEEMTRNFDNIFTYHLFPTSGDINAVQNGKPAISGYTFNQVVTQTNATGQAYVIASGPYAGLTSLRDSWRLDATATSYNTSEVHLTREFYNHKIPIFQFGIFYNRDLAIHPGPVMYFSGRVHSNANLYVMSGNGIYFENRVTAVGQVIRDWNRNGKVAAGNWDGKVFIANPSGTPQELKPASGGTYYASAMNENLSSPVGPAGNPDPGFSPNNDVNYTAWKAASTIFGGNLQAQVPLLQLPIQIGLGKDPIELIKRAIDSNDYQASVLGQAPDASILSLSRYCNKPGIRVSLSDSQAELPGGTGGVRLDGDSTGTNAADFDADGSRGYKPQAMTGPPAYQAARINGFRLYGGANYPDNGSAGAGSNIPANRQTWIKVELVNVDSNQNVTSTDVTKDFLSLGMTDTASDLTDSLGNSIGDSRAILKMQRYEIPGAPVRVADVNVADGTSPNTMNTAQAAIAAPGTLPAVAGLSPTTANYVWHPAGTSNTIAVGPFNVFTYQTASGTVGNFNYVSMTNNNYTPSMAGDPTSTALSGYSVLTNLHQNPNGTLNYFNGAKLPQLSNVLGNNIWGTNAIAPSSTNTGLPVTVNGFTWAPSYPAGYLMSSAIAPPSFRVTVVGAAGNTYKLTFGSQTTAAINWGATAAQTQTALTALSSVGAGNCLVTLLPGGAGTTVNPYVYTVYFSNYSIANNALTTLGEFNSSGLPSGTVAITYTGTNLSMASIEATAFGKNAVINVSPTARGETVVPFPIEIFNPREGIYSGDTVVSGTGPTGYTTSPVWDNLYANGTNDKTANAGTVPTWAGADIPAVGVMSLIDVDVANLRSFLNGTWDGSFPNGLTSSQVPISPGWILYVSDRRGDRSDDGEYAMEDIYGPSDGILQPGEDANSNGVLDVDTTWEAATYGTGVPTDIAAFFDHQYFRRGVRLINGSQLPGSEFAGFTLATENPAYILGNYNATGVSALPSSASTPPNFPTQPAQYIPAWDSTGNNTPAGATTTQVPASVAADGVWILSNNWQDSNSFRNPLTNSNFGALSPGRQSTQTAVRAAFFMGSTQGSILATPNQGGGDACLDGGVHNFPRFLENWGQASPNNYLNYCGSLINPFNSRQAIGAHKTGAGIYSPPNRNWTFDSSFLDIRRCPPGTPLFQFIQTTGFRETTRQES